MLNVSIVLRLAVSTHRELSRTLKRESNALGKCVVSHWQLKKVKYITRSKDFESYSFTSFTFLISKHLFHRIYYRPHQIVFLLNNLIPFWYIILFAISSFYKHSQILKVFWLKHSQYLQSKASCSIICCSNQHI